jgi:hypothetical protein
MAWLTLSDAGRMNDRDFGYRARGLQVGEGTQATSEIVERKTAAHAMQHTDEALRMLDVRDDGIFRDLEADALG